MVACGWSLVSASLRMPCSSAAISVSGRSRLASVYYDMLAIVLLRKESDGWRRGEKEESAGSEGTWDLLLTGGEGRAVCETQTVYGRTLSPTGVSLAGSHLSILIQNSLLRCLV